MAYKTCLRDWVVLALGLLLLVACAPAVETAATVPVARPITATSTLEATTDQPTPLPASVVAPTTSTAISTPTATSISTEDVQATHTAIYATEAAEAATHFAPTPTFTPSPTFTPVPGPVWPIFFRVMPCPQGVGTCEDSLGMDYDYAGYVINSDGSHLTPITDLEFPDDFQQPVFSANGTQLAYQADFEPEGVWHLFLANADGSEAVDLGTGAFFDYQFTSEPGCLIGVRFVSREIEGLHFSIEKRCMNQPQPQVLEAVTFPVFYAVRFSPQGDALLVYGQDSEHKTQLLVHQIGGGSQIIYSPSDDYFASTARWLPDGKTIEFTGTGYLDANNIITTTFNLIERDGNNLQTRLSVAAPIDVSSGMWSPDGQEFAFTYGKWSLSPEESGLYILDLNTGEWRQILSHVYTSTPAEIDVWKQDTDEVSE